MSKRPTSKPRLYKTIFEALYRPKLEFYERLYPTASKLSEYKDWQTDRLSVILRDYERHMSLTIRHNRFSFEHDNNGLDSHSTDEAIDRAIDVLPVSLDINTFTRLGLRKKFLVPIDISFTELVSLFSLKFFNHQEQRLIECLPQRIDDLLYRVDASTDDLSFHITAGPVQNPEIPSRINFNKEQHLEPSNAQEKYSAIIAKYPKVAIFFDIDVYRVADFIELSEISSFKAMSSNEIAHLTTSLTTYLFSVAD